MDHAELAARFRALHQGPGLLVLANVWDALSAHVVASSGARAIATASAALAWAHGQPDGEAMSLEAVISAVREIARSVSLPLTVDLETGWSDDPSAVVDAVTRVAEAGAVGVNLEDAAGPPERLAEKLRACKVNRATAHVFLNARTDVFLRELASPERRLDEAIARLRRYEDAGADGLFVPKVVETSTICAITEQTSRPLNLLAYPGIAPVAELAQLHVRRLSVGPKLAFAAMTAAKRACNELFARGTYARLFDSDLDFATMNAFFASTRSHAGH